MFIRINNEDLQHYYTRLICILFEPIKFVRLQVCKNWRQALFHPSFWKDISFIFEHPDRLSFARNLVEYFALSVRQATVRVFTPIYSCELDNLLKHLRGNRNLKRLILEPTSSSLEWQNATCDGDELEIFEG